MTGPAAPGTPLVAPEPTGAAPGRAARWHPAWLWRAVALGDRPWVAAAIALVVYGAFAIWHGDPHGLSPFPYYQWLADAFLHGQTSLRLPPRTRTTSASSAAGSTSTGGPSRRSSSPRRSRSSGCG